MHFDNDDVKFMTDRKNGTVICRICNIEDYIAKRILNHTKLRQITDDDEACYISSHIFRVLKKTGIFENDPIFALQGIAKCHNEDQFDKSIGRSIAFRRAYKKYLKAQQYVFKKYICLLENMRGDIMTLLLKNMDTMKEYDTYKTLR